MSEQRYRFGAAVVHVVDRRTIEGEPRALVIYADMKNSPVQCVAESMLTPIPQDPPKPELPADSEWEYTGECVRPQRGKHEACLASGGHVVITRDEIDAILPDSFSGRRHILRRKVREPLRAVAYLNSEDKKHFNWGPYGTLVTLFRAGWEPKHPRDDNRTRHVITIHGEDEPLSADELVEKHNVMFWRPAEYVAMWALPGNIGTKADSMYAARVAATKAVQSK